LSNLLRQWFAEPRLLWLLAALPVLWVMALWARRQRRRALALVGGGIAFDGVLARRRGLRLLRAFLFFFGFSLLIVGTAGPRWGRDWSQSATRGRDLVVVLDLSRSMLAESPSRLARAQRALLDLAEAARKRGGHRLGLVVFASRVRLVCPLTHDYGHFQSKVKSFDRVHLDHHLWPEAGSASGTRIGAGLALAVEIHDPERYRGAQDILLVSDGDDPADDSQEWRQGARLARARGIPVHVIGVGNSNEPSAIPVDDGSERIQPFLYEGTKVVSRLEEGPLQDIASETDGTYIPLRTSDAPVGEAFFDRLETEGMRDAGEDTLPVYRRRYAWFLVPAFCLLALTVVIGDGARRPRGVPRY
jgi:Ca-activated chloride channel homolog